MFALPEANQAFLSTPTRMLASDDQQKRHSAGRATSGAQAGARRAHELPEVATALPISLAATALALFVLGLAKGKVARLALLRSGLQVLVIGGASAGVGYLIGTGVAG
jgi:hypothetical protein